MAAVNMNDVNLRLTAYQVIPPTSQVHNKTASKRTGRNINSELRNVGNLFRSLSNTLTPITQSLLEDKMKNVSPRRPAPFAANTKHD